MALSIVFDLIDRDGNAMRRRQRVNRTVPASDPTTITIALPPGVGTLTDVFVEAVTDGTEAAGSAPDIAVANPSGNTFEARIKTQADKVKALFTTASGF